MLPGNDWNWIFFHCSGYTGSHKAQPRSFSFLCSHSPNQSALFPSTKTILKTKPLNHSKQKESHYLSFFMEAKALIFSFSLNRNPRYRSFNHVYSPYVQTPKRSFRNTHLASMLILQKGSSSKSLVCRNSMEKTAFSPIEVDDSPNGSRRKKLAVFVSGGGSNFTAIHEAVERGIVNGEIAVLVTDKAGCGGANYARDKGIPIILFPKSTSVPEGLSSVNLVTALRTFKIDLVLLAGYLKLIPVELVRAFPRSIVNIHPSLLPAFGGKGYYGLKVHKAVIASGARYSGPTIHFVDEQYDTGRILAQRVVPVLVNDTAQELAARVLHEEHKLYVEVVAALCEGRIVWREDGVPIIQCRENPNEYR